MAENKKQHYVPQFLLRFFSINDEGTKVKIYSKTSNKIIKEGRIDSQAYKNYFYGKDLVAEKALGQIETATSKVIKEILEKSTLPKKNTENYIIVWLYSLIQAYRTKFMANEANEMIDKAMKSILKHDNYFKDKLDSFNIGLENAPVQNLQTIIRAAHIADDLEPKLLINKTKNPFITSDNPVVLYNQFLEEKKFPSGRTGLASKGLQIFFPLSPSVMFMLYDKKVYKIGSKNQSTVLINDEKDIDSLNVMQFLNSEKTTFSNQDTSDIYLKKLIHQYLKLQTNKPNIVNEYPQTKKDGTKSILTHYKKRDIGINLKLSFIKKTVYAKKYKLNGTAAEFRRTDFKNR